jgi:hypothetical protein
MAKTPQNPLSYVGQGTAGAATVLPSTPFNPQQFFSDLIGEKKAEAQLELKKREDVQNHNMAWFDRISKYNKDYGELWAGKIEGKASNILDELTEMALTATTEGRMINYAERAKANQLMGDLQNDIATSKMKQREVDWIIKQARERNDVKYDQYGIELMMQDIEDGTYSLDKMNTHYLLPERQYTDDQVRQSITAHFGTHTQSQGDFNIKQLTPESIRSAWEIVNSPISELSRHVNNLAKAGHIEDTPEAKEAEKKRRFDAAVNSENTSRTRRQSIVIDIGGGSRHGLLDSELSPSESRPVPVRSYDPTLDMEISVEALGYTPIQKLTGGSTINLGQNRIRVDGVGLLPVATKDLTYLVNGRENRWPAGQPISPEVMRGYREYIDIDIRSLTGDPGAPTFSYADFRLAPYFVGTSGTGNKPMWIPVNQTTSDEFADQLARNQTWGQKEYDEIMKQASNFNRLSVREEQYPNLFPSN